MSKDLHIDFKNRKIKKTNKFVGIIVYVVFRAICKSRNVRFEYDDEFKGLKDKQVIVLCQHKSSNDYIYVLGGLNRLDIHILVGYQNVFQKGIYHILKSLGVIGKMLYQPDMKAVIQTLQSIKLGESVAIFPEGIQSTSGSSHPINPGTMSLLMKCKLPVILAKIEGSYFAKPRYTRDIRKGSITVKYSKLFDTDDFNVYSEDMLYKRLFDSFKYNEFDEHKDNKIAFKGKLPNIYGLDNIIYKCPHCSEEFTFYTEGDEMRCSSCGFSIKMDEYCDIHSVNKDLPFGNIDEWYKWQRRVVSKEIESSEFFMTAKVELRRINTKKLGKDYSLIHDGEGILTINNEGLIYKGTKGGENVELVFNAKNVYSLTFSLSQDLDLYYLNKYYNFNFLENGKHVVKWMLAAEEIHNIYDADWKAASEQVYDYA